MTEEQHHDLDPASPRDRIDIFLRRCCGAVAEHDSALNFEWILINHHSALARHQRGVRLFSRQGDGVLKVAIYPAGEPNRETRGFPLAEGATCGVFSRWLADLEHISAITAAGEDHGSSVQQRSGRAKFRTCGK